ncbi:MAG: Fic family protein [Candidatus Omnitrophica bacterium]|nr:Fic family protein [Candidatus Omnitrophota bacterium]
MEKHCLNYREKIDKILEAIGISRSGLARRLEVSYKTVYRWLDKGVLPHRSKLREIDQLFKEYVDLKDIVLQLCQKSEDPIKLLKTNKKIRDKFTLDLTYHSNAIEGNHMTIGEVGIAFEGQGVRNKEASEALEATNHKKALEFLLGSIKPNFEINQDYILNLHKIIMDGLNYKLPGEYRTGGVNLTDAMKTLCSAQEVPLAMNKFIKNINSYQKDVISKIAHDHYEFEAIHPFFDGNGRVGRLIAITQSLSKGFAPVIIRVDDRNKYYLALGKADLGYYENMVGIIYESLIRGYELLRAK